MEILERARNMMIKLNDIQPAVSIAGMEDESAIICEIKKDLRELIAATSTRQTVAESVMKARFDDLLSSAKELKQLLFRLELAAWAVKHKGIDVELADRMIGIAMLAAETFAVRAEDYIGSKASLETLFNEG